MSDKIQLPTVILIAVVYLMNIYYLCIAVNTIHLNTLTYSESAPCYNSNILPLDGIDSLLYMGHNSTYMQEQWLPVKNYEGFYEVSNLGRIRSIDRVYHMIMKGCICTGTKPGKYLSLRNTSTDYIRVCLFTNTKKGKHLFVHKVVALTFIPNPDNKPMVNHIDGNKLNNKVENLEWCTAQENTQHAVRTGLQKYPKSCKHPSSKLTTDQVVGIKSKYKFREYIKETLANEYNVSISTITAVLTGDRYAEIR